MMWNYGYHGFGGIGMIIGGLFSLALIVGFVLFVIWAVRKAGGNHNYPSDHNLPVQSAKDIAQMRYAKGEITRDEYQQILTDLNK